MKVWRFSPAAAEAVEALTRHGKYQSRGEPVDINGTYAADVVAAAEAEAAALVAAAEAVAAALETVVV